MLVSAAFRDDIQISLRVADRGGGVYAIQIRREAVKHFFGCGCSRVRVERHGGEAGKENGKEKDSASHGKLLGFGHRPRREAVWGNRAQKHTTIGMRERTARLYHLQETLGLSFANSRQAACCFACRAGCLNFPLVTEKRVQWLGQRERLIG